jgi:hypothetical protein
LALAIAGCGELTLKQAKIKRVADDHRYAGLGHRNPALLRQF